MSKNVYVCFDCKAVGGIVELCHLHQMASILLPTLRDMTALYASTKGSDIHWIMKGQNAVTLASKVPKCDPDGL